MKANVLRSGMCTWLMFCWVPIFLPGCVNAPPASRIIYEDLDQFVRLEVIYRSEGQDHDHPVIFSSTEMTTVLKDLSVTPRPAASQQGPFAYAKSPKTLDSSQLFPDHTLDSLSQNLAEALQRATAAEDVLFYLNYPRGEGNSEITSGGLFVEGKQLHLLFANYRHPTVGNSELTKARARPLEVLGQPLYDITPGPFGKIQASGGVMAFVTGTAQHLAIDYPTLLKTHGIAKDGNKIPPQERASSGQSISEKLQELHVLRDKNLVTEGEFQNLKSKLLNSF